MNGCLWPFPVTRYQTLKLFCQVVNSRKVELDCKPGRKNQKQLFLTWELGIMKFLQNQSYTPQPKNKFLNTGSSFKKQYTFLQCVNLDYINS